MKKIITLITFIIIISLGFQLTAISDDFAVLDLDSDSSTTSSNADENDKNTGQQNIMENQPKEETNETDKHDAENNFEELILNDEFNQLENHTSNKSNQKSFFFDEIQNQKLIIIILLLTLSIIVSIKSNRNRLRVRFFIMLTSLSLLGFYYGGCICTVGALQNISAGITTGQINAILLIILAITILSAFFFGKIFCGYVCPIGALQDFLFRKNLQIKVPKKLHDKLKYIKYIVLILTVSISISIGKVFFEDIEPFKVAFDFSGTVVQIILFVLFLVASLFIYRSWCRYFCPLGALLSIFAKLGLRKNKITGNCTSCSICKKLCSYGAVKENNIIDDAECIQCGECKSKCPSNS